MKFSIVVAVDIDMGIGKDNTLPWRLPGDLKRFKQITTQSASGKQNAVIMGRKTWDSLPPKSKPLPGRMNIVLTRQESLQLPEACFKVSSFDEALKLCEASDLSEVFVIGGSELFAMAVQHPDLYRVYLTEIYKNFSCDCFFPAYGDKLKLLPGSEMMSENDLNYTFKTLENEPIVQLK